MKSLENLENFVSGLYTQLLSDRQTYYEWGLEQTAEAIDIEAGHIRTIMSLICKVKKEVEGNDN